MAVLLETQQLSQPNHPTCFGQPFDPAIVQFPNSKLAPSARFAGWNWERSSVTADSRYRWGMIVCKLHWKQAWMHMECQWLLKHSFPFMQGRESLNHGCHAERSQLGCTFHHMNRQAYRGIKPQRTLDHLAYFQIHATFTHINYLWHKSTVSQISSSIKGTTLGEKGSDASAARVFWAKPWYPSLKREKTALLRPHRKTSGFRNKSQLQHEKFHYRPHPCLSLQVVSFPWEDQEQWKLREKWGPPSSSSALVNRGKTIP